MKDKIGIQKIKGKKKPMLNQKKPRCVGLG
jgi:hypothetical protein